MPIPSCPSGPENPGRISDDRVMPLDRVDQLLWRGVRFELRVEEERRSRLPSTMRGRDVRRCATVPSRAALFLAHRSPVSGLRPTGNFWRPTSARVLWQQVLEMFRARTGHEFCS
ncbi:MAG: hypothetical protein BGO98_35810 [Myxococcales bacterium 68-20]|nr:MAG: hypothetical protein BGO98_35810 [Myxococcales bacterium 68-20]